MAKRTIEELHQLDNQLLYAKQEISRLDALRRKYIKGTPQHARTISELQIAMRRRDELKVKKQVLLSKIQPKLF